MKKNRKNFLLSIIPQKALQAFWALFVAIACISNGQEPDSCFLILNYIEEHLSHSGVLKNANGFVYVDLEDEYIHELVLFIRGDGFEEPPYFEDSDLVGAHITVAYPDEMKKYNVKTMQEYGEPIGFTPKGCQRVHPPRWEGVDEIYLVVVQAPELDLLREKYGLPKREYDFHITIGVKRLATNSTNVQRGSY